MIVFDDSDSEHPGIDINYAGPSSSKHNTSSNSPSSGYSSRIRDAADEPPISPGTIFKQQLQNLDQESMAGYHDPSAAWRHLSNNLADRWEIFSSLGLTPKPRSTYETTGFAYPTSHQLLQFNAAKEHKIVRKMTEPYPKHPPQK